MSKLRDVLNACIDHVLAPECAFDRHSAGSCENPSPGSNLGQQSFEWHNNFGTAADYQVPAESDNLYESWDWSSSSGGGFEH